MCSLFKYNKNFAFIALVPLSFSLATPCSASLYSVASIDYVNLVLPSGNFYGAGGIFDFSFSGDLVDTGAITKNFTGLDSQGNEATTIVSAQAFASASYSNLKAYSTISVANPLSLIYNPPYVADANSTINPNGIPQQYIVDAYAVIQDAVEVVGPASYIRFRLDLNGSVSIRDQGNPLNCLEGSGIAVFQDESPLFVGSPYSYSDGNPCSFHAPIINQQIWSNPIPVTSGVANYQLELYTRAAFYGGYLGEGGLFGSTADASHTLNLLDIYGYDANGNQVNLDSAIGAEGFRYNTSVLPISPGNTVPEPGTFGLTLSVLGAYLVTMRSKRRGFNNKTEIA